MGNLLYRSGEEGWGEEPAWASLLIDIRRENDAWTSREARKKNALHWDSEGPREPEPPPAPKRGALSFGQPMLFERRYWDGDWEMLLGLPAGSVEPAVILVAPTGSKPASTSAALLFTGKAMVRRRDGPQKVSEEFLRPWLLRFYRDRKSVV